MHNDMFFGIDVQRNLLIGPDHFVLFQDLHVDPMLNGLVLGESLLNDAVALVLCSSIEEYERVSLTTKGGFEVGAFFLTVAKFFSIFLGSVGLGAGVAFVSAILTKGSVQFPISPTKKNPLRRFPYKEMEFGKDALINIGLEIRLDASH